MPAMCEIERVCAEIAALAKPQEIILYNYKVTLEDEVKSFDLCVVTETADKTAVLRDIYRTVDCALPFEVIVYTPAERERLADEESSFLYRILSRGRVLYRGEKAQ